MAERRIEENHGEVLIRDPQLHAVQALSRHCYRFSPQSNRIAKRVHSTPAEVEPRYDAVAGDAREKLETLHVLEGCAAVHLRERVKLFEDADTGKEVCDGLIEVPAEVRRLEVLPRSGEGSALVLQLAHVLMHEGHHVEGNPLTHRCHAAL